MKAKLPKELNETLDRLGRLADVVLAYHPKAKVEASRSAEAPSDDPEERETEERGRVAPAFL